MGAEKEAKKEINNSIKDFRRELNQHIEDLFDSLENKIDAQVYDNAYSHLHVVEVLDEFLVEYSGCLEQLGYDATDLFAAMLSQKRSDLNMTASSNRLQKKVSKLRKGGKSAKAKKGG